MTGAMKIDVEGLVRPLKYGKVLYSKLLSPEQSHQLSWSRNYLVPQERERCNNSTSLVRQHSWHLICLPLSIFDCPFVYFAWFTKNCPVKNWFWSPESPFIRLYILLIEWSLPLNQFGPIFVFFNINYHAEIIYTLTVLLIRSVQNRWANTRPVNSSNVLTIFTSLITCRVTVSRQRRPPPKPRTIA